MHVHPSSIIDPTTVGIIRNVAREAEISGRLHDEQLAQVYQHNWFNLFVPAAYGGLELSLPAALQVEEALAWTDGSLGWTVTLCSGANFFIGYLQPEAVQEIFKDRSVCLSGSGRPSGRAIIGKTGYEISGYWKYATGAPHATVFTAACILEEAGKQLLTKDGEPMVQAFWFHRDEVRIDEDWRAMGMIATASHSFETNNRKLPLHRGFILDPAYAMLPQPVFRYPFMPFAEATLCVNISGMALRFLEIARSLEIPNNLVLQQQVLLDTARTKFYDAVYSSWNELLQNGVIQNALLAQVSLYSRALATTAFELVHVLHPFCGMRAVDPRTEINRIWRNMHTASQHKLVRSVD